MSQHMLVSLVKWRVEEVAFVERVDFVIFIVMKYMYQIINKTQISNGLMVNIDCNTLFNIKYNVLVNCKEEHD